MPTHLKPFIPFGLFLGSLAVGYIALAWTAPSTTPPGNNVSAPINVSGTSQTKSGQFIVNTSAQPGLQLQNSSADLAGLLVDNNAQISGYTHFNGYGEDTWIPYTDGNEYFRIPSGGFASFDALPGYGTILRINNNGNIGIGVNPSYPLDFGSGALEVGTNKNSLYLSGVGNNTYLSENWGVNLNGNSQHPIQIPNAALLVGFNSSSASYTPGNLYVGPNGGSNQICLNGNCVAGWPSGSSAGVSNSAGETVPNDGPVTALTFDTNNFDSANMHSTATNPSRLTIQKAGVYVITSNVYWRVNQNVNGIVANEIRKNGTTYLGLTDSPISPYYNAGVSAADVSVSVIANLSVGDYLENTVWQSSGVNLTVLGPNAQTTQVPWFSATWISAQ